jgi:hypothetical protein
MQSLNNLFVDDADFVKNNSRNWLKGVLREGEAIIVFTKSDGIERTMKCTLSETKIPAEFAPKGSDRAKNDETLAVFDLENQGWRSFRWDSVKSVNFSIGES